MPQSIPSKTLGLRGRAYRAERDELLSDAPSCVWCGAPADTADHMPPVATMPRGEWSGILMAACERCNKGNKAMAAFHGRIPRPKLAAVEQVIEDSQFELQRNQLIAAFSEKCAGLAEEEPTMSTLNSLTRIYKTLILDEQARRKAEAAGGKAGKKDAPAALRRMIERRQ